MSKKNKNEIQDDQVAVEGEVAAPVEGEVPASKGRAILLTDPSTGEQVARKDVIKAAYEGGMTRSEIKKMLAEKYSHEVAYQIVFAATKNLKAPAKAE